MSQNTYDMKSSENNVNPYLNSNNLTNLKYYDSKIGKENPNSLAYKLRELKENQNKMKINNDSFKANLNNSNSNLKENSQITNKSRYSRHKNIPISNNYINDNTNNNNSYIINSRKNTSRQKQTSSTAQIDEQYEMQKLLELENKNYTNKFKDVVYKKLKDKDINLNNNNNNSINTKNNNYSNNNLNNNEYDEQINNKFGLTKNLNTIYKENDIDKNIKNYIDEQAEKIKEFIHDEINNLHVDLIRQFEIQNSQNLKMLQEFSLVNKHLYQEIQKLKNENKMLKNNLE